MNALKLELNDKGYIRNRESDKLEFKESFHNPNSDAFSKLSKTIAGFANSSGGCIVFGIKDSPHLPCGINDNWYSCDPQKITLFLQEHFSPEIKYDQKEYNLNEFTFGVLQVFESDVKPVICTNVDKKQNLKLNAIYKRYGAKTEEIRPSDFIILLNNEREKERSKWMKLFEKIAKVGVENIGLLNLANGEISGSQGKFYIDESLLSQIKFINEGQFVEKEGAPTLKLMGSLEAINIITERKIGKAINTPEIIRAFLEKDNSVDHLEYLKQISNEISATVPIHFYISNIDNNINIISIIEQQKSNFKESKKRLIDRIKNDKDFKLGKLKSGSKASKKIEEYLIIITRNGSHSKLNRDDWDYYLKAFTHLKKENINDNIFNLLLRFFNDYYEQLEQKERNSFRYALCHVDKTFYK